MRMSHVDSSARSCTTVRVATTDASPRTEPTDRSMPPAMMTNVMPIESTPMTDACRTIVKNVFTVRKLSPAVIAPTAMIASSATMRPRLRPKGPPRNRRNADCDSRGSTTTLPVVTGGRLGGDGCRGAGGLLAHAAAPFMTRSSTPCSSISDAGTVWTMRPSATTSTVSARPSTSSISLETMTTRCRSRRARG